MRRWVAGKLLRLGPARQGVRTVSGPEGSSTKGFPLGAAGSPGLSNLLANTVFPFGATFAMMSPNDLSPAAQTHPTRPARRPPLKHWRARLMGGVLGALLLVGAALATDYLTRLSVTLEVNGARYHLRTHAETVQAALDDAGIAVSPPDTVWPPPDAPLETAHVITVRKANVVVLLYDGKLHYVRTLATHPLDILSEQGIVLRPRDVVIVDGAPYPLNALTTRPWNVPPETLRVVRSVAIVVQDGEHTTTLHTTALNVASALESVGLKLYVADRVTPALETPITADMRITVERAVPVTVIADGRQLHTRAHGPTVADALVMVGVVPLGLDYTLPPLDAPLEAGMTIRVVRVTEQVITQEETIPFLALQDFDPMPETMGKRNVPAGIIGVRTTVWCVRYEDGKEVRRELWSERLVPHFVNSASPCEE